jgi:hypothetical protein
MQLIPWPQQYYLTVFERFFELLGCQITKPACILLSVYFYSRISDPKGRIVKLNGGKVEKSSELRRL